MQVPPQRDPDFVSPSGRYYWIREMLAYHPNKSNPGGQWAQPIARMLMQYSNKMVWINVDSGEELIWEVCDALEKIYQDQVLTEIIEKEILDD